MLPEAQVDRFLMRLAVGYPEREEERQILRRFRADDPLARVEPVASVDEVRQAAEQCRRVYVHPALEGYMLDIVRASRRHAAIALGVSPRGSMALHRTSQALAAIRGRHFVLPDDVKHLVTPVLAHRIILSPDARLHSRTAQEVWAELVEEVAVPVEETWAEDAPA